MLKADFTLETDPLPISGFDTLDKQTPASDLFAIENTDSQSIQPRGPVARFVQLDERSIRAEQISGLIVAAVFIVGALIALGVLVFNLGLGLVFYSVLGGAAVLITLSIFGAIKWPHVEHRHASWRLDEEGLEIRRGVFWRHQITIPLGRVQHADVSQGPLQRPFGLGSLTIHTAGTQNASVELKGLAHEVAIELRDRIVKQRNDQHVV